GHAALRGIEAVEAGPAQLDAVLGVEQAPHAVERLSPALRIGEPADHGPALPVRVDLAFAVLLAAERRAVGVEVADEPLAVPGGVVERLLHGGVVTAVRLDRRVVTEHFAE